MRHVPGCEPGKFKRHCTFSVQRKQPANRPREGNIGMVPAHRFVEFDPLHQPGQDIPQHLVCRVTDFLHDRHQVGTPIDLPCLQVVHTHTLALGKSFRRTGGVSVFVKTAAGRWSLDQGFLLLLQSGKLFDHHDQPARGANHSDCAVRQPQFIQQPWHSRRELFQRALQVCGR